ncbi:MAG: Rieske 2Fe-2S domain-containing protein [bacterium]
MELAKSEVEVEVEVEEVEVAAEAEPVKTQKPYLAITRRIFLDILGKGIFGAIAGAFIYPIIRYLMPPQRSARNSSVVEVSAAEVTMGKSKIINYKETPTIVINTASGLVALSAVCTHLGCIVQWDESSQEIVCPCHGAKYDLNGNVKSGPAPKPLTIVKATLNNDKILVGEA